MAKHLDKVRKYKEDRTCCYVDSKLLATYDGYVALDIDGVFSDTPIGFIRHNRPELVPRDITEFIECHPSLFSGDIVECSPLCKYGVESVSVDSLAMLCDFAVTNNVGFVIVSSWVRSSSTGSSVETLMRYLTNIKSDKPLVVGQTAGLGGSHRENRFFHWLKRFTNGEAKPILAIDDSGSRHFQLLSTLDRLIVPNGRIGFTTNDHLQSFIKLGLVDHFEANWAAENLDGFGKPIVPYGRVWQLAREKIDL